MLFDNRNFRNFIFDMRYLGFIVLFILVITGCGQKQNKDTTDSKESAVSASDSIDIVTELILKDSGDYRLFLKRAYLNLETGKVDPAFRDVNMALEIEPKAVENFILLSDLYFVLGNIESAVSALRKAAELEPESDKAYIKLAETYLVIKNYSMAKKSADIALSINQDNEEAFFLKAIAYLEEGDTTAAITNLRIASNMDITNYAVWMQLASVYQQMNDTLAFNYYNSALRAKPDDELALFNMASFYQELGKFEEALSLYEKLNTNYPLNKWAFYNKGYILLVEYEEFDEAANAFQYALNIDPLYVDAVYNLGRTYEAQGLIQEAVIKYRQALELETNYPLAIDGLNRLGQ